jgi:ATP adenylyltransferase
MVNSRTSGEAQALPRQPIDAAAYERRSREGPCFVCQTLAGNPDYPGYFVWTDDHAVAFLARYNTLLGHVAPLPPGVPDHEQQLAAFSFDRGVLALPDDDMADLARRIAARVEQMHQAD